MYGLLMQALSFVSFADEYKTFNIGDAKIFYDYKPLEEGVATLMVTASVAENNDSLRGVKNSDQRRLSKLGQLNYQCKLLLYKPDKNDSKVNADDPILISKNYSLSTGVDVDLTADESVAVQLLALRINDSAKLFSRKLAGSSSMQEMETYVGEGVPLNMARLTLTALNETDFLKSAETVDIDVRFPVFQLEKPVYRWHYTFNLADFGRAIVHVDAYCTLKKFLECY